MRSIVCHKEGIDEQNLAVGGALKNAGVCDCVRELQLDRIQHESMTFQSYRLITR